MRRKALSHIYVPAATLVLALALVDVGSARAASTPSPVPASGSLTQSASASPDGHRFESGFLSAPPKPAIGAAKDEERHDKPSVKSKTGSAALGVGKGPGSASQLEAIAAKIKGLNELIQVGAPGTTLDRLLLNRAASLNLYARERALRTKGQVIDPKGRAVLSASVRDAQRVLDNKSAPPALIVEAHRILGLSELYLDRNAEARTHFIEVIKAQPNSTYSPSLALLVAEDLFESGEHAAARGYYAQFRDRLPGPEKDLADYKIAWCDINLGKNLDAIRELLDLAQRNPSKTGLGRDALRDSAYLIARLPDPRVGLQLVQSLTSPQVRVESHWLLLGQYEALRNLGAHRVIVEELLKSEKDPKKRLSLAAASLRIAQLPYASRVTTGAFHDMEAFLKTERIEPTSPTWVEGGAEIEEELQRAIRTLIDTFGGRIKTPEKFTREELASEIESLVAFHETHYPGSPIRTKLTLLRVDICLELKRWSCVASVTEGLIEGKAALTEAERERVRLDQLSALLSEPNDPIAKKKLTQRLREFLKDWPKSTQWPRVARSYVDTLPDTPDGAKESLPILERIFALEPSPRQFYRIQYARFRAGDLMAIDADARSRIPANQSTELTDLRREVALKLASDAQASGDDEAYKRHLKSFLASAPSEKAFIARRDYLDHLSKKGEFGELSSELLLLPEKERLAPELDSRVREAWAYRMKRVEFADAVKLVARHPRLTYLRALALACEGQGAGIPEASSLKPEEASYLLGLLALGSPPRALAHLDARAAKHPLSGVDRELAALALRVSEGQWPIKRTPQALKLLGPQFAYSVAGQTAPPLRIEKQAQAILPEGKKLSGKLLEKMVASAVTQARALRPRWVKESEGQLPNVQARMFSAASALETRVGRQLLESPVPAGLAEAQVQEYKAGIAQAAQEFEIQAGEFKKLAEAAVAGGRRAEGKLAGEDPGPADLSKWSWPKARGSAEEYLKGAQLAADRGKLVGALALVDLARAEGAASKDSEFGDEEYFRARGRLLVAVTPPNASLRIFVKKELEARGMSRLLASWKGGEANETDTKPDDAAKE